MNDNDIKYWPDDAPSDGPRGLTYGCLFSLMTWAIFALVAFTCWSIFAW